MTVNVEELRSSLTRNHLALPAQVVKRDGATVPFDISRIERAVEGCYSDFDLDDRPTTQVSTVVEATANILASRYATEAPTVEQIQDTVEAALVSVGEFDAARNYMAYRDAHTKERDLVPPEIRDLFNTASGYFPSDLQLFQFFDKYARFNWDLGRRETWVETVDRNIAYLRHLVEVQEGRTLPEEMWEALHAAILNLEVMPSMRSLAMAGEAAIRDSLSVYNCSYQPVDSINAFVEAMRISMAGCGVGYSVERQYVENFPKIERQTGEVSYHLIEDSSFGWAEALRLGLEAWFAGRDVTFEYGLIRPAGTPLKVKGGRASGPEPLRYILNFCRETILKRQGGMLRTLDAHDMMCVVGGGAVSGGVRRTAMISLYSWDDTEMRDCKIGAFPEYRWNANNSAVWPDGLTQVEVIEQMMAMVRSERGEPGIFSRENANRVKPERRANADFGTNPCGEINLRPKGLCNLTIAVARHEDTEESLYRKVELATIIGTIQSLAITFPGMSPEWAENCVDERLLGVDITGQADCPLLDRATLHGAALRQSLKRHAIEINARVSQRLGINASAAITCDKPSGNSSQFLNCSSGLHRRWSPFYLRRTRVNTDTPVYRVLQAAGVPMTPENGSSVLNANTYVIAWPVKSPEGALTRKDFTVVDQCEFWLLNKQNWTEHNPSVTITYQEHEVLSMIDWVWNHRDLIGGMAFLPADDHGYQQPPYEEITEAEYLAAVEAFPSDIDWSLLYAFEQTDMTEAAQTLACTVAGQDC